MECPLLGGGTNQAILIVEEGTGTFPRRWGNFLLSCPGVTGLLCIPSYVGEPRGSTGAMSGTTDHPLVCWGTDGGLSVGGLRQGVSPRMWGNRQGRVSLLPEAWWIPSYVGEPLRRLLCVGSSEVDPLVCGGTWCGMGRLSADVG